MSRININLNKKILGVNKRNENSWFEHFFDIKNPLPDLGKGQGAS